MKKDNIHTTNYTDTFIEVSEDTKVNSGTIPGARGMQKTIAEIQYELLTKNPYKFTSDDIIFQVHAIRNDLTKAEQKQARAQFFSKGQPCLRTSPITKTYGFGVHADSNGKVAVYGMETKEYEKFQNDPKLKKVKAMRNSRKS